jgi:hypothetical protein
MDGVRMAALYAPWILVDSDGEAVFGPAPLIDVKAAQFNEDGSLNGKRRPARRDEIVDEGLVLENA